MHNTEECLCEICANDCDDCICPACCVCGDVGNQLCYAEHGMERNEEQILNAEARMREWADEDDGFYNGEY